MFASCYPATLASNTAHRPQRLSVLDCAQFRKGAMMPAPCRYTQVQNNTQQKERQFLTSAPTRAPCARENAERRFRPEDSRYARDWLAFALKDSEKAPGGCGACERISTRTSVREKSLEHSSAPPGAFAASSHFAGCKPAKFPTSCPCRRPGLLRRERRGRGRPWGSR